MSGPSIEKTLTSKQTFIFKDLTDKYFNPNWHFHTEFQISLILEGTGTRFVGDQIQSFGEGDLVLTGTNLPHLWRSDDAYYEKNSKLKTKAFVIYFDNNLLSSTLLEKEEFYKIKKLLVNSARGIEFYGETIKKIKKILIQLGKEKGFSRIIKLLEIIDVLSKSEDINLLASPGYNSNGLKSDDAEKMRIVYDYVMKNFKTKISLDEIADMLNMTTTSFCRYFKPRANKTFTRFVNDIRIGHARKLLLEDNYNISEISYECGFNALSNFNRQFKSITGKSPNEYRSLFLDIKARI
ncbi:AraC family transcriptional regulator [Cellulophaga sp. F20128]|uniref:AraC family transcriptional regulator n=1 Tax=Cellulophaga sp. F20128 TaxID=2926413 RepID=UPI001FF2F269|nr:AraC family transcriptional regulator [Cellulophaga sp. F20128]MCK0157021.1 AraC family transcriptional regulator [Cellulophaga sp. F20128]